jgi:hypothetical protein
MTLPANPVDAGLVVAQQLATAYAVGDWETARRISPLPKWDDATYEEGFAGLEASTLWLAEAEQQPGRVALWLLQRAYEVGKDGPQTSIYCVRWDYLQGREQIERVAGEFLYSEPGFVPPYEGSQGESTCSRFDQRAIEQPDASNLPEQWIRIEFGGNTFACAPRSGAFAIGSPTDFACELHKGSGPVRFAPELWCSQLSLDGAFSCTPDRYYPNDIAGYEIRQIGGERALCKWPTLNNCWIWPDDAEPAEALDAEPSHTCVGGLCWPTD